MQQFLSILRMIFGGVLGWLQSIDILGFSLFQWLIFFMVLTMFARWLWGLSGTSSLASASVRSSQRESRDRSSHTSSKRYNK